MRRYFFFRNLSSRTTSPPPVAPRFGLAGLSSEGAAAGAGFGFVSAGAGVDAGMAAGARDVIGGMLGTVRMGPGLRGLPGLVLSLSDFGFAGGTACGAVCGCCASPSVT